MAYLLIGVNLNIKELFGSAVYGLGEDRGNNE